jgi:carboxyl-terminal processing protease
VIIGTATYGKGLVQQVMQFSDETALKLTTSKYYLPSGRCLQKPDWTTYELLAAKPDESADTLFFTDSGRPVYGGGGIVPDIHIDGFEESDYVAALKKQACFFDFAIDYSRRYGSKVKVEVNDATMMEFKRFVAHSGFAFLDDERAAFDGFKDKLSYLDDETGEALRILEKELNDKETWAFENHYSEIRAALSEEIALQSNGEEALYSEVLLKDRAEIEQAREILSNSKRYLSILAYRSND